MKIPIIISAILVSLTACQPKPIPQGAQLRFETLEVDMGSLVYKADATCSFEFFNSGKSPLLIQQVKTSCGCTVAQWDKRPIKANQRGKLSIKYDTSHPGRFRKTITVFYNGEDSPQVLSIKGSVAYPENFKKMRGKYYTYYSLTAFKPQFW